MTQPFKGYEQTLSKARRFPSQDKARQVWSSGARHLEGMGARLFFFRPVLHNIFRTGKKWRSYRAYTYRFNERRYPLPSSLWRRHQRKPNGIGRRYTYILSVEYVPITLSAGELHHLKSKALSGNMVVFYQQYAEKHLLFLQFFPLTDVYSSLKHHAPMRRVFSRTSKNHWFSRQYLGWSKNILPYYLRQIFWLCIERVLMVCGGMFGVWSRVGGLVIKFT